MEGGASRFGVLLFVLIILLGFVEGEEEQRITALPGQPRVNFSQFSGYVTVSEKHGRALFYWLTQAHSNASIKPLLLWLNGDANILFLESPAGVGYSYTNTSSDLRHTGDKRTARDSLIFILKWLDKFPRYKYREFYISGESYAGHYVPQLAQAILEYNKRYFRSNPIINLKGFIVGNAVMDNYYDNIGTVTYWWTHSIISDKTYKRILKSCDFRTQNTSRECDDAMDYAMSYEFGEIDPYSIYTPKCEASSKRLRQRSLKFKNNPIHLRFSGYDPCTERYAEIYYNRPDVQKALHANTTGIPYKWTACSDDLLGNWKDSEFSMLPTYKKLIAAGLRIWVFSGDTDSVVPVTATRFSLRHLNLKVEREWYPWYSQGQVAGWTEVYKGLTFATVRGAGHEVPLFQPERALTLFRTFLSGKYLPDSSKQ
ncbi:serine carboxypeptidase 24-like isoform X2 [Andrographis paniculata]|uniref:serine carboxypeptidase 24-like isoform X2 n=1 Tax=Andrographis paniculata TaxID=175694 RepID=UPI0021E8B31F|nr:serine carboxypeptidase 24-like isoform X2 [Andrographis paniculata]